MHKTIVFSDRTTENRRTSNSEAFFQRMIPVFSVTVSGICPVKLHRKRSSVPFFEIPWARSCHHSTANIGSGILTETPFRDCANYSVTTISLSLGPIDPCPSNVDMETFPTSVFNDRNWIIATTTKICTEHLSTQAHAHASTKCPRPPTNRTKLTCDYSVSVTCCYAIHFQDQFIRQVSCYTLLSGCRLPWPPSCCQNELITF